MAFAAGTRLGVYEISGLIGVGGMGEVYKARDRRLNRIVAIKVLPEHIAADPDLKQRFEREAKAISSLSHPHICTLFDVGTEDGVEFLVMEYLEGETLAQRLEKGALPLPQVLRHGVEIAEALEQAHRRGVTHRDLKPGNVMLTKAGAKLLDFGLAKLRPAQVQDFSSERTAMPDAEPVADLTATGTWLGTLQYMAPEQLEGRPVDHRADVFAFGAIMHEMATGKKAFDGRSRASLIGAILKDDPQPISAMQPLSPPVLDALVATCLAKDPDERWQSAGDVGRQLRAMQASGSQPRVTGATAAVAAPAPGGWRRTVPITLVAAALAGVGVWGLTRPAPLARKVVSRFAITPVAGTRLTSTPGYDIAISPDGTQIAYFAATEDDATRTALYVRSLDELAPKVVAGTQGIVGIATSPFFSPDGRSIGFGTARGGIARIALGGGAPRAIVDSGTQFAGGAWSSEDTVIFSSAGALYSVSAGGGGTPERLETAQMPGVAPTLLPGGRAVLYTLDQGDTERAVVLDLETGKERIVVEDATNAKYAPSGHLVFGRGATLMAAPFDLGRLVVTGEPVTLVEDVRRDVGAAADFALSDTGTLVYVPGASDAAPTRTVSWIDRAGRVLGPAVNDPGPNARDPRLSPNGRRLALTIGAEADGEVWLYDLEGRPAIPLAEEGDARLPIWNLNSAQIAYVANLGGTDHVFTEPSDGSNREPQQPWPGLSAEPGVWLAGDELIATRFDPQTRNPDIIVATPQGGNVVRDVLATADMEFSPELSPDGRWLAYVSDRTGQLEVWVMRYPGGAPERVSSRGGIEPVWSRDGRELFYRQETGGMMAVAVDAQGEFQEPTHLFDGPYILGSPGTVRSYDVAADGRFLMVGHSLPSADVAAAPAPVVVVQNWPEELKQRVPTK